MTDTTAPVCRICSDQKRDQETLCVVEDYLDMLAIERTGVYRGRYHVLGGVISPLQGVTPDKLHFDSLFARLADDATISEVILAMNPNIE